MVRVVFTGRAIRTAALQSYFVSGSDCAATPLCFALGLWSLFLQAPPDNALLRSGKLGIVQLGAGFAKRVDHAV